MCDKYGILVWDEYWLDDTVHYGIEKQKAVFLANARDMLLHYRNHPCIALWCEKNEFPIGPPFESGLRKVTTDLDPQRWLQACSSSGNGVADGSYGWQPVAYYFSNFKDPFHTEIGAPSIPTLESLHGMMPASDWETFNDDWTEHDMCQFDYPIQVGERYGPVADTDDFVRKAQLIDYETYRAMFEGRNSRLLDPYTGVMIWMSNPAQPSMVWQIYSYDLEPDSSYFGVKHACEMVHIQMTPDGRVQVINNTSEELDELHVSALVCNMDGTHALYQPVVVDARPLSATNACDIKWPQTLSPVHFIRLRLSSGSGKLISDNFYWHTTPADTGDCSALQTLPHVDLGAACTRSDVSGRCDLHVTLSNPGHSVALMAHLQLRRRSSGERVLPAFYSDNYVSLLPGERKTIDIDSAEVDLHGDSPELTVDGWNVTVNPWSGRGVYIAPNPEAGFAHATSVRNIKCGYGWVPGYAADCYVTGGQCAGSDDVIDTSGVLRGSSSTLYRSERFGECTYTIPVASGKAYAVALDFAETFYKARGQRVFNVSINGQAFLTNFDIVAAAGAPDKAIVETARGVRPDANGNIVIHLFNGPVDQPKICGIQIHVVRLGFD